VAGATAELDVVRRPGDSRVVEMRVVEIGWEGSTACLASLRDITDRKRAEAERAELIRAHAARMEAEAALRARDEFLAATAHELKTPLTRLRLYVQRARRRLAGDERRVPSYVEEALRWVDLESEHLARLASQLLDVPRIESGTFVLRRSATDLGRLVEAAAAKARATIGEDRLIVRTPAEPVVVSVDRRAFEQIVANAIANALRSSPPGEPIEVELTTSPPSAGADGGPELARLVVRDHGIAAPPEDRPRLFGRSFPVHSNAYASGLGLWLYLSRQLAELHNGRIDVEFPDCGGTRVVVTLPLA
jgi:signal transduction histidine kinase